MKIAIVGSRSVFVDDLSAWISPDDEIVSGDADGVDRCAAEYAEKNGLRLTEFLPKYDRFGRAAPIVRNREIVDYADRVIVFWDGYSKGAQSVIQYAKKAEKPCEIILCPQSSTPAKKAAAESDAE